MRLRSNRASVVLVALSCVTVLGIAMASFLAVTNQSMRLSNRDYAKVVSKQLAEMGLELALQAYNANTFSTGWTLSGSTATVALTTVAAGPFPALLSLGSSGITPRVNVRVEHYLAAKKATPWSVLVTYAVGDSVWYQGVWYRCKATTTNQDPSTTAFWTAAPQVWDPYANYKIGNIVLWGGIPYRCIAANINNLNNLVVSPPPNATYWTAASTASWNVGTAYSVDTVAYSGGVPYRCIAAHTGFAPPNATYWLSAPVIYSEGVATLTDSASTTIRTQLRAMIAPAPLFPNAIAGQLATSFSNVGNVDSYNAVLGTYNQTTAPFSVANPNIGSSAVVAAKGNTGSSAIVAISRVRVNGYVAASSSNVSPYAPRYTVNTSTGIITSTPVGTTPSPRVDPTRISRSPNIPKFDIQSVSSRSPTFNLLSVADLLTATPPDLPRPGDTVTAADGKYYYYTDDHLALGSSDLININGPVVIDIRPSSSGKLEIINTGKITINNTATASLEIHFDGLLNIQSDNAVGGIDNLTMDPKRCILIGTSTISSNNNHYLRTFVNNTFYGVIYMPDAYLHMKNNYFGVKTQTIYGALSAETVFFDDSTTLRYDTSLRTATFSGVDAPYRITEWRELTDPSEKIVLP